LIVARHGGLHDARPIEQFRDGLQRRNIIPPTPIIGDGKLRRCDAEGRNGKGDAAYLLHLDGIPAGGFENHRDGLGWETWRADIGRPVGFAESEAQREREKAGRSAREADAMRRRAEASERAQAIWKAAIPAPADHPYLIAKDVSDDGLRVHKGALVVPMRDADGVLHSLQFIGENGPKRYLKGGRVAGCYFSIGKPGDRICIAEGYATGATIHEATGCAVAVAFDAGNLRAVGEAIKAKRPAATLILCADDDYRIDGNPGIAKATEAALAVGGLLALADFGADRPDGATDFNDVAAHRGREAVERAIANARAPDASTHQPTTPNLTASDLAGREWPEPQPIRAVLHPVPPFDPVALLPGVLRDWVMDEAEPMPCAPDFVAAAVVVALGATIGARCAIKPKARDSWPVVPNLWGRHCRFASAKKSPAIDVAMSPVDRLAAQAQEAHRHELEAFETDRLVCEARRDAIKDAIKAEAKKPNGGNVEAEADKLRRHKADAPQPPTLRRYRTNDATVEKLGELLRDNPAGLLVLRDELVGLLASWTVKAAEGDRSFFLEAWNGTGNFDTDRIGRGSILIPNLCVSIFGGIQPDKLTEYLEQAAHALGNDGTLQRFQVLVYPDARPWEWRDRAPNKQTREAAFRLFELLADFDPVEWGALAADDLTRFPHFRFADDAQEVFIEWLYELQRERIAGELSDGHPLIAQHLAKYEKLFPALALILQCVTTRQRGPINKSCGDPRGRMVRILEAHARRCYGLLADEGRRAAQALAARVERGKLSDGFTARDVRRNGWRYLSSEVAVRAALEWLEDEGWLQSIATANDAIGGRPTVRYRINPKIMRGPGRPTAETDETLVSAALAVPHPAVSESWKGAAHG
jgi:putative DNA primase/helicase